MDFPEWYTVRTLQDQVYEWSLHNFGDQPAHRPLLGVGEELGELASAVGALNHAFLKQEQQIRMDEDHQQQMEDAVGDIVIYLADFCSRSQLNMDKCIRDAWRTVQKREWK